MRTVATAMMVVLAGCGGDDGGSPQPIDAALDAACDRQRDPTCCGGEGHDCLGGACEAGVCQPSVIVDGVEVSDLALAGSELFVAQAVAGLVERVGVDGTGRTTIATDHALAVAARAGVVAWATSDAVWRQATGEPAPVAIATGEVVPCDVAIDDAGVLWTTPEALRTVGASGAAESVQSNLRRACGLAVGGATVYVASFGTNSTAPTDGQLTSVARAGGTALTLADNRHGPRRVIVSGAYVYWTEEGSLPMGYRDGRVMRMSRTGGLPEVISDEVRPLGVFADGNFVYWVSGGAVKRFALADRTTTTIASSTDRRLADLVADDTALYIGVSAGPPGSQGQIWRLAR